MTLSPRSRTDLQWQCIPAVGLLLFMLVVVLLRPLLQQRIFSRYKSVVAESLASNDLQTADLFVDKLRQLASTNPKPEVLFQCARIDQYRGNTEQAHAIMKQLAPKTGIGYGDAHLWLAREILTEAPAPSPEQLKLLLHHLQSAVHQNPDSADAHGLLGQLLAHQEQDEQAISSLVIAVSSDPGLHLPLAECYRRIGMDSLAMQQLEQAEKHFAGLVGDPTASVNDYVKLTQVFMQQAQFLKAEQLLTNEIAARQKNNDQQSTFTLSQVLADICVQESKRIINKSEPADSNVLIRSLFLIGKALTHDVRNKSAIRELLALSIPDSELGLHAEQVLPDQQTRGRGQFTVHLILGIRAVAQKQDMIAAQHFRRAADTFNATPVVLCNTALFIIGSDGDKRGNDSEFALRISNHSLELVNGRSTIFPFLAETRGRVLGHMHRWQEAIVDLHKVLESPGEHRHIHGLLAVAYEALGDEVRAEAHRRLCGLQ